MTQKKKKKKGERKGKRNAEIINMARLITYKIKIRNAYTTTQKYTTVSEKKYWKRGKNEMDNLLKWQDSYNEN